VGWTKPFSVSLIHLRSRTESLDSGSAVPGRSVVTAALLVWRRRAAARSRILDKLAWRGVGAAMAVDLCWLVAISGCCTLVEVAQRFSLS
jgi:hypothetical protein